MTKSNCRCERHMVHLGIALADVYHAKRNTVLRQRTLCLAVPPTQPFSNARPGCSVKHFFSFSFFPAAYVSTPARIDFDLRS